MRKGQGPWLCPTPTSVSSPLPGPCLSVPCRWGALQDRDVLAQNPPPPFLRTHRLCAFILLYQPGPGGPGVTRATARKGQSGI